MPNSPLKTLTLASLKSIGACAEGLAALRAALPPGWPDDKPIRPTKALAKKVPVDFRRWAAENLSMPPATLATLATDQDPTVRANAAANLSTPPAALAVLATDQDRYVRANAAAHPSTPKL